jgi:hypothetical protein
MHLGELTCKSFPEKGAYPERIMIHPPKFYEFDPLHPQIRACIPGALSILYGPGPDANNSSLLLLQLVTRQRAPHHLPQRHGAVVGRRDQRAVVETELD